jgi:hypothetical protein
LFNPGRRCVWGQHFAACFFHGLPAKRAGSLTQAAGACHRASTLASGGPIA